MAKHSLKSTQAAVTQMAACCMNNLCFCESMHRPYMYCTRPGGAHVKYSSKSRYSGSRHSCGYELWCGGGEQARSSPVRARMASGRHAALRRLPVRATCTLLFLSLSLDQSTLDPFLALHFLQAAVTAALPQWLPRVVSRTRPRAVGIAGRLLHGQQFSHQEVNGRCKTL
jgi:hypothetical protein